MGDMYKFLEIGVQIHILTSDEICPLSGFAINRRVKSSITFNLSLRHILHSE